jgi:hypothetical protein
MIVGLGGILLTLYMFQHGHWFVGLVALAAAVLGFCWPGWWMPRR